MRKASLLGLLLSVILNVSVNGQEKTHEVIIIGAGLSGLTSAYYLKTNNVLILERKAQAGGRIIDGQWNGFHYPKGTEYMGKPEGVLKQLITDLDLDVIQIPPPTDGIGYKGTIYTKAGILDFLPTKKDRNQFKALQRKLSKLDKATEGVLWEGEDIDTYSTLDDVSVAQWLSENQIHPLIQRYIEIENLGLFSANNEELSILYNANEMAYNLPSPKDFWESEVFTFENGMVDLSNALSEKLEAKIKYGTEVISVNQQPDGSMQVIARSQGEKKVYKAKKVICTTPAPIAKKILANSISTRALEQLGKVDYGQYITINIFTEKRWLKEAWTVSCLDNYFTSIYDVTRTQTTEDYNGKSIISAYIPSTTAKDKTFILQSDEDVLQKTLKDMEHYFPGISKSVLGFDVQRFNYAYPVFGLGYYSLLQKLENDSSLNKTIFLTGDYMKYAVVDGAILSGYITAQKVNKLLR
ncbi:flavin monoamine oxidase family protein [Sediminicola luteus]|uniref:Amine oxidase domain-containing protein n=1 Tax=Sediminicola luteus TaxID=319238 RepID=A0A2A4G728_9FLAO|nr:NAD(P)/FAD-dependent oxidoreductase [Sediminicola luteus]PCE63754.1 hypothetical protein B7P33_10795 [Sediminicola luteus]